MGDIANVRLRQLQGQMGEVVYQFTKVQFSYFSSKVNWRPAINAYRCRDSYVICADLAGVDKSAIDVAVEPKRVVLRGKRPPPDPADCAEDGTHVLTMEIDYGFFEREITLPVEVDPE